MNDCQRGARVITPEWFLRDVTPQQLRRYVDRAGGVNEFVEEARQDCWAVRTTIDVDALHGAVLKRLNPGEANE